MCTILDADIFFSRQKQRDRQSLIQRSSALKKTGCRTRSWETGSEQYVCYSIYSTRQQRTQIDRQIVPDGERDSRTSLQTSVQSSPPPSSTATFVAVNTSMRTHTISYEHLLLVKEIFQLYDLQYRGIVNCSTIVVCTAKLCVIPNSSQKLVLVSILYFWKFKYLIQNNFFFFFFLLHLNEKLEE